jgi:hypothetical protein
MCAPDAVKAVTDASDPPTRPLSPAAMDAARRWLQAMLEQGERASGSSRGTALKPTQEAPAKQAG